MIQQMYAPPRRPSFGERLSTGISRGLEIGQQLMQQHQQKQAVSNLYGQDVANAPPEIQKLYAQYALSGKQKQEQDAAKLASNRKQIADLETKRGLEPGSLSAYEDNPAMAERISKPEKKPAEKPKPKSETAKIVEKDLAKGYVDAKNEIPKLQSTLANIAHLRNLGKNELSGFKGYVKSGFGTASASEYNTLGATLLDPVIKIFNPVGAVPTSKLNWIKDTFKPSAGEFQSTQSGKLATLERLANQAMQRAQQKMKLFNDFNGEPPESEVLKFDNESSQILNNFINNAQYIEQLQKEVPEGKILMLDPEGKPLHVDINSTGPNGESLVEFYLGKGATLPNE
jgi:hypothetical protein